jgi:hypothetical protein
MPGVSRAIGGIFKILPIEFSMGIKLLQRVFQFHDISKIIKSRNEKKNYLKMSFE